MAPNARVWRMYFDEAGHFDAAMVESILDTVDVTLVSAGLFSAVISALVAQIFTALKSDFSQVTAALLMELIAVQGSMPIVGAPSITIPSSILTLDSPSTASTAERWVSGLWFVSLAFSLATALLYTGMVKQWIQAYVSPTFGTPHIQSQVRHFR
ncbi:hypothetical protein BDV98DRAFT_619725 [Pterulicium gracile]|uniref:DUF6535 domain-containing protein n=1 Tax=Pterulicium gracile TaxID=1884261 RepID=A0A5C3QM15_9AGAR|nr:hypothetical protein BDV98DRAFT_619725 [Pterula gracilis]